MLLGASLHCGFTRKDGRTAVVESIFEIVSYLFLLVMRLPARGEISIVSLGNPTRFRQPSLRIQLKEYKRGNQWSAKKVTIGCE
jgi:hypothetical protein